MFCSLTSRKNEFHTELPKNFFVDCCMLQRSSMVNYPIIIYRGVSWHVSKIFFTYRLQWINNPLQKYEVEISLMPYNGLQRVTRDHNAL